MGPSKPGPSELFATDLVSLGKSGRYQNRPASVDAKSQFMLVLFSSVLGWAETA